MALTVVWEKCAVDKPDGKGKGGTTGVILNRGEELPDWVSDFVRSTLTMIGAVRDFGIPVQVMEAAVAQATNTEVVPAGQLPPEVPPVETVPGTGGTVTRPVTVDAAVQPDPNDPANDLTRPAGSDNKEAWEQYAVAKGYATQGEAETLTKSKLVALVNEREQV